MSLARRLNPVRHPRAQMGQKTFCDLWAISPRHRPSHDQLCRQLSHAHPVPHGHRHWRWIHRSPHQSPGHRYPPQRLGQIPQHHQRLLPRRRHGLRAPLWRTPDPRIFLAARVSHCCRGRAYHGHPVPPIALSHTRSRSAIIQTPDSTNPQNTQILALCHRHIFGRRCRSGIHILEPQLCGNLPSRHAPRWRNCSRRLCHHNGTGPLAFRKIIPDDQPENPDARFRHPRCRRQQRHSLLPESDRILYFAPLRRICNRLLLAHHTRRSRRTPVL